MSLCFPLLGKSGYKHFKVVAMSEWPSRLLISSMLISLFAKSDAWLCLKSWILMWCSPARFAASLFTFSTLVSRRGWSPPHMWYLALNPLYCLQCLKCSSRMSANGFETSTVRLLLMFFGGVSLSPFQAFVKYFVYYNLPITIVCPSQGMDLALSCSSKVCQGEKYIVVVVVSLFWDCLNFSHKS